jgi:hypothetical protein
MDSSTQAITPLRQRMIDDMRMRKLADKTQSHYIRAVRQFAGSSGQWRSAIRAGIVESRAFRTTNLCDLPRAVRRKPPRWLTTRRSQR